MYWDTRQSSADSHMSTSSELSASDSACWLLQLPVEKSWSVPDRPFFSFLAQTGEGMLLLPCRDSICGILGSFQFGGAFSGRRGLSIECLLMSGCGSCGSSFQG